jgi:hypothetical protein
MAERIPRSTSYELAFKAFLSSTGAEATGLTIAITISAAGATSFTNPSGGATNATEIASGWYFVTLTTSDTGTLGRLAVRGTSATINDVGVLLTVVSATSGGATNLDAASSTLATPTNITAGTITTVTTLTNLPAIPNGWLTSAGIAANALDAVWSTAARLLTAGTNIVLAKGVGVTGFNDLAAADVRTAVGLASANLDTQIATLLPTASYTAPPTAAQNATQLLDQAAGVETGLTVRQQLRLAAAALFGKASGLATATVVMRDTNDTVNRITATVDVSGDRTAVTLNPS